MMHEIDRLGVPPFDVAEVRRRATRPPARPMRRRIIMIAALGILVPALATAAVKFVPFEVTHKYGMWQVYPPKGTSESYVHPTQATLAKVAQRAPYRVIWPADIPTSSRLNFLGSDASQLFTLAYQCPGTRTGYSAVIIIPKNYPGINANIGKWFESQTIPHGRVLKWTIGEERVLLESTCLSSAQMARVRRATIAEGRASR